MEPKKVVLKKEEKNDGSLQLDLFATEVPQAQKQTETQQITGNYRFVTQFDSFAKKLSKQLDYSFAVCGSTQEAINAKIVGMLTDNPANLSSVKGSYVRNIYNQVGSLLYRLGRELKKQRAGEKSRKDFRTLLAANDSILIGNTSESKEDFSVSQSRNSHR